MIKAIRGTRDLLPPETALWNFVEAAVRDVFRVYNFHEIRTPIFEDTQLFTRSVGEETDIVAKEMYTWHDRGGAESEQFAHLRDLLQTRLSMQVPPQHDEELLNAVRPLAEWKGQSLTLRPENTAGVVRAYIEHKLWERGLNKLYYIGPSFVGSARRRDATGSSIRLALRLSGQRVQVASLPRATRKCWNCWRRCLTGWALRIGPSSLIPSAVLTIGPSITTLCARRWRQW